MRFNRRHVVADKRSRWQQGHERKEMGVDRKTPTGLPWGAGLLVSMRLSANLPNDPVLTSLTGRSLTSLGFESERKRGLQDIVRSFTERPMK